MTLLAPLALLWLGTIPILIWLWRFAATRHQTRIPSLVPFEHLVRRPPTRRARLIVNGLFWVQVAALTLVALALASPALLGHRTRTVLVLLDTSASMGATLGGPSPFQQARAQLVQRLGRRGLRERFFLVSTAPGTALTPEPTADVTQLQQLIQRLSVADLAGNLSVAHRIGQALLGSRPDETLVLTDEPSPSALDPSITFRAFDAPLANVAIVGVDAHESVCAPTEAQLVVTVKNFAEVAQQVRIRIQQRGRSLAETDQRLAPNEQVPMALRIPEETVGLVEIVLQADRDALAVDNRAFVMLRGRQALSVVVDSDEDPFVQTIGAWLEACPGVTWRRTPAPPEAAPVQLVITDRWEASEAWPAAVMAFVKPQGAARMILTHWLLDPTHPITAYLEPLERVALRLEPSFEAERGEPVLWGLVEGRKIPLVATAHGQGRRIVGLFFDPTATPNSVPVLLVFLNSLHWLLGSQGLAMTGEPLRVGAFDQGVVRVVRPDGAEEELTHEGGVLRYEATTRAGIYRFVQHRQTVQQVVNVFAPGESDTIHRHSTWASEGAPTSRGPRGQPSSQSIVPWLLGLLLGLLGLEWALYLRKGHREFGPSRLVHSAGLPRSQADDNRGRGVQR